MILSKNLLNTMFAINSEGSNVGGWAAMSFRNHLNTRFHAAIPLLWQKNIIEVIVRSLAGNMATDEYVESHDKVFLPSNYEITGDSRYSGEANGKINFFTDSTSRIKFLSNGDGAASIWATRTPIISNTKQNICFNDVGVSGSRSVTSEIAICFGFCIG